MTTCVSDNSTEFQLIGVVAPSILELELLLKALGTTSNILATNYYITYNSQTRNFKASIDESATGSYYIAAPVPKQSVKTSFKPHNHGKRWTPKENSDLDNMFTGKPVTIELIQEAAVKHSRTFVSIQSKLFEKKYITFKESVDISLKNAPNRQLDV